MISTQVFKKVLDRGIELSQFALLGFLYGRTDITELLTVEKIKGQINLLIKRGLVLVQGVNYVLTQKGKELYEEIESGEQTEEKKFDILSYEQIHQSLLDKLKSLTGKTQVTTIILKRPYKFMMSNLKDFRTRLEKVVKEYGVKDLNKIQQCLLIYIEECYKNNSWSPLLMYYISREGVGSRLMTDYENYDESIQVNTEEPKKLVRTKDLFH